MPNLKSAEKRVRVTAKKQTANKLQKSRLLSSIRKFKKAVEDKKFDGIDKLYSETVALIDSACSKSVIKKNTADRNKARLATLLFKAKKS